MQAHERGKPAGAGDELKRAIGGRDKALRERDALGFVGIEQPVVAALAQHRRHLPSEVDGVSKTRIHTLSADGAVDMGGVAQKKCSPGAKLRSDAMVDVVGREPVHFFYVDA